MIFDQPPAIVMGVWSAMQSRGYSHYYSRDMHYLQPGESGNCTALAFTAVVEAAKRGGNGEVQACVLKTDEGHAYAVIGEWVIDSLHKWPLSLNEMQSECEPAPSGGNKS